MVGALSVKDAFRKCIDDEFIRGNFGAATLEGELVCDSPVPAECDTGDWRSIKRVSEPGQSEVQPRTEISTNGRVFIANTDAEGNGDITNEAIVLSGTDYAGVMVFSADASLLAYGDHTNSASPHITDRVKIVDTETGALLHDLQFQFPFGPLWLTNDWLVAGLADPADPLGPGMIQLVSVNFKTEVQTGLDTDLDVLVVR